MRRPSFLLLPLLVLACSDQTPVEPLVEQPAFNFLNNPDNGNFRIWRFQDAILTCWTDPGSGLRACHATVPLGGGSDPDCGLQSPADPIAWQMVVVDEEAVRVAANVLGDVWITVRNTNVAGVCFGSDLVAEGWGSLHYTDNDAFGVGSNNANQWGFTASGLLTTPAGDLATYAGHARFNWNQNQLFQVRSLQVVLN